MALGRTEKILILAKTYPSPSAQYVETSCVAGISENGSMRRLFPVPFRMVEDDLQFKKWQWIDVRVEKASKDHRKESHRVYVDTIKCNDVIDTKNSWAKRSSWLEKVPIFSSCTALNESRISEEISIGLIRPKRILGLDITKVRNAEWTDEEREKLLQEQMQGSLFSQDEERKHIKLLRKMPYDFHYRYICDTAEGEETFRHKIVDWEACALFWNCHKTHGPNWEDFFRTKLEIELPNKDLMFLMGNQHRFRDQWLIISLIYPPKRTQVEKDQWALF
jgi:hypothetical protein